MSSSRMSISSSMTASRAFEQSLNRQATENAWKSFGSFYDNFTDNCQLLNDKNMHFVNSFSNSVSNSPELEGICQEETSLTELLQTCGNMQLNKIMMLFASLVIEVKRLEVEGYNFIPSLVLYGHQYKKSGHQMSSSGEQNDGEDLLRISKFLPVLLDLYSFLNRVYEVVGHVILQLEALFCSNNSQTSNPNEEAIDVRGVRFDTIYEGLGNLCVCIINLDQVMSSQVTLKKDLISYKRIMDLALNDPNRFGLNSEKSGNRIKILYQVCGLLERHVIDSFDDDSTNISASSNQRSFFSKVLQSILNASRSNDITRSSIICDHFASFIRTNLAQLDAAVPGSPSTTNLTKKWMSLSSLLIVYIWLFKKDDKKLLKSFLDTQKKLGLMVVHLIGEVSLLPEKFLFSKIPKGMFDKKMSDAFASTRNEYFKNTSLPEKVSQFHKQVYSWIMSLESAFDGRTDPSVSIVNTLSLQMKLLQDALSLSFSLSTTVKTHLYLHLASNKSLPRKDVVCLCKLLILLKAIQVTLKRNKGSVILFESSFAQYHSCLALKCLNGVKTRLVSQVSLLQFILTTATNDFSLGKQVRKYSEKKLDVISSVILFCNVLNGPVLSSNERRVLTQLCLSMIGSSLSEIESSKVIPSLTALELVNNISKDIEDNCCIDSLFSSRVVFYDIIFPHFRQSLSSFNDLRYFFFALNDFESLVIRGVRHDIQEQSEVLKSLKQEVMTSFTNHFLQKFSSDFETELRLQTHLDLKLEDQNPLKGMRSLPDFATVLSAEPLRVFDSFVSVKVFAQDYLNSLSYNLTSIALHDYKTYESMMILASNRYGLDFVNSQLPCQRIEQGLDVLEITRSMHIFVTKYSYNLNNQIFVEKASENKHLNVLLIRHVANSITTHGYGIINTAVNLTYQFLRKKFNNFSQFLFEEHVKSRLIKDLRLFREDSGKRVSFQSLCCYVILTSFNLHIFSSHMNERTSLSRESEDSESQLKVFHSWTDSGKLSRKSETHWLSSEF